MPTLSLRGSLALAVSFSILALPLGALAAPASSIEVAPRPLVNSEANAVITSSGSSLFKAPTDTLFLYGGPGTLEGKFETAEGAPDKGGWTGRDLTEVEPHWQVSEFNASTLNNNGPGNLAAWCGRSAIQEPDWDRAPGYGNNRFDVMTFQIDVANPAVGQTVALDFFFHHDTERGYDFFEVQYDSFDTWVTVMQIDGTDSDFSSIFTPPGVQYSTLPGLRPIVYAGGDYGRDDKIRVRMVVRSDGAFSDQDGFVDTFGAVQVDDVVVTCSEGVFTEDFESGFTHWIPEQRPFVGDFFDVYPRFADTDPCRENKTPVAGFIDYGQDVNNSATSAAIPGYPTSTGGSVSAQCSGVVPEFTGCYVVNYTGGLTNGLKALDNRIISPVIAWDLPGTADDGPDYAGAILRFDLWGHTPLLNGIFWKWGVQSSVDGVAWTIFEDRGFVDYNPKELWLNIEHDVSDLLLPDREFVRISLGVLDLALFFGFPGDDATAAPLFDNVAFQKYQIGGPVMNARHIDLANDAFPRANSLDVSSQASRDLLDIRFDMARDVMTDEEPLVPGDSIFVDVEAMIPGTTVADARMVWVLDKNPLFEDAIRAAPARPEDENVDTSDPLQWRGEVVGSIATTSFGGIIPGRYVFDLPDEDFLYPGDRLRYYFQATDSDGRVSTLPDDTSGFLTGNNYNRAVQMYGLPSLFDDQGDQPKLLVINESGRGHEEAVFLHTLGETGRGEGFDYDTYTVQGPTSGVSNGIGSAQGHGATADQLAGYDVLLYLSGPWSANMLSDGTGFGWNDKGDDIGVLTAWHDLPGRRSALYFGDSFLSGLLDSGAAGQAYAQTILSAHAVNTDVSALIGGQTAPVVLPLDPLFQEQVVAYGGCFTINAFDQLFALPPATALHGFEDPSAPGTVFAGAAASVAHARLGVQAEVVIDMVVPFALQYVYQRNDIPGSGSSDRSLFLDEILSYLGLAPGPAAVAVPTRDPARLGVHPTPFNPRTVVSLSVPSAGKAEVEIFDLRGRRVAVLHSGELEVGESRWNWDGVDDRGASVASGVYVIRATGAEYALQKKAVLLK